VKTENNLSLTI